jgi:hypothetical protein
VAVGGGEAGVELGSELVGVGLPELAAVPPHGLGAGRDPDCGHAEHTREAQDLPQPHGSVLYRSHERALAPH